MATIEEIEKAVAELTPEQLAKFRAWFDEFQERMFDEQIATPRPASWITRCSERAKITMPDRVKSSNCPTFETVMPAKAGIQ